jgi:hypothetical protein
VDASLAEGDAGEEKVELGRGEVSYGLIKVRNRRIELVNVVSVTTFQPTWGQYGGGLTSNYVLAIDHLSRITPGARRMEAELKYKKSFPIFWKTASVRWKGSLSKVLNSDSELKDRILRSGYTGGIWITCELQGYHRIRTSYYYPSSGLFDLFNTIAERIR